MKQQLQRRRLFLPQEKGDGAMMSWERGRGGRVIVALMTANEIWRFEAVQKSFSEG